MAGLTNTIETFDRRWVIFGAVLIQLCLGAIYAWSVFTAPLKESGWSVAQTQYVFTAGLVSFALVMICLLYTSDAADDSALV